MTLGLIAVLFFHLQSGTATRPHHTRVSLSKLERVIVFVVQKEVAASHSKLPTQVEVLRASLSDARRMTNFARRVLVEAAGYLAAAVFSSMRTCWRSVVRMFSAVSGARFGGGAVRPFRRAPGRAGWVSPIEQRGRRDTCVLAFARQA